MPRNNIKLLTKEQQEMLDRAFYFELKDDFIVVKLYNYERKTLHDRHKSFTINSKVRKVTFTKEAIDIWCDMYNDDPEMMTTLFDVQQAANRVSLLYQTPTRENVEEMIKAYPVRYLIEEDEEENEE